jgi:dCMP deaminase
MVKKVNNRPSWDEYFLGIMEAVAKRATCDRGRVGCVIARDKRILATGYAGAPAGTPHCDEVGHELVDSIDETGKISKHCVRTAHGEQNAIAHAARNGIALDGATLYNRMTPCYICAKMIINAGITRVVALHDYHASARSKEIFKIAGVKFELIEDKIEQYAKQ